MRIGIFGGTFDPVHCGHLKVAEAAFRLFSLDRLYFVPAGRPPHKESLPLANAWHRYAMLILATKEKENFFVSTIELETKKRAYTIDTVGKLRKDFGSESDLYLIIGADSFEEITTWKEAERLLSLVNFIVMSRPNHSLEFSHLPEKFRREVIETAPGQEVRLEGGHRIYLCRAVCSEVSATAVREAIRKGEAIDQLVSPEVAEYIKKYHLYLSAEPSLSFHDG